LITRLGENCISWRVSRRDPPVKTMTMPNDILSVGTRAWVEEYTLSDKKILGRVIGWAVRMHPDGPYVEYMMDFGAGILLPVGSEQISGWLSLVRN
jgi:hypothetical protein